MLTRYTSLLFAVTLLVWAGCAGSQPVVEPTPEPEAEPAAQAELEPEAEPEMEPAPDVFAPPPEAETAIAGRFDNGKMWTFDYPPTEYFEEAYGFTPDEAWFEKARLGALRLPNCTASFVSPNGLAMTNHHCGRAAITQITQPGEDLTENGFYARDLADERRVPNWYVDQLVAIEDVTDEVYTAEQAGQTDAERVQARQDAISAIQARLSEAAEGNVQVQVVSLYNGGRYSAYTFRRFTDLRIVMTPELDLGFFGGDTDNFTYPRYAFDATFFRVYDENGEPYQPEAYFEWSEAGAEEDDPVFVVGNPGSTNRLETTAQLIYRREVQERYTLDFVKTRVAALQEQYDREPDPNLRNQIASLRNAEKAYTGRLDGLSNPDLLNRRFAAEREFQQALEADTTLNAEYGDLIEELQELQRQKLEYGPEYKAFFGLPTSGFASALLRRALPAYTYLNQQQAGASEEVLASLRTQITNVPDQPPGQNEGLLAVRLQDFVDAFGEGDPITQAALQDRMPYEAARQILENSQLATASSTAEALDDNLLSMEDPALELVAAFAERYQDFQSAMAGLGAQQQALAQQLGRARFELYGTAVPPDATFSLRIADGIVKGYPYNGTVAPPYTTFYGLYDHYHAYGEGSGLGSEWDLPERWLTPPESFDLATPMNLVSTNDIIGGNSGSPLLNQDLEIVGLVFDGNMESLPGSFIFVTDLNRTVAVDARGILEALDEIYDMDRIVLELTEGQSVPTEEEADTVQTNRP